MTSTETTDEQLRQLGAATPPRTKWWQGDFLLVDHAVKLCKIDQDRTKKPTRGLSTLKKHTQIGRRRERGMSVLKSWSKSSVFAFFAKMKRLVRKSTVRTGIFRLSRFTVYSNRIIKEESPNSWLFTKLDGSNTYSEYVNDLNRLRFTHRHNPICPSLNDNRASELYSLTTNIHLPQPPWHHSTCTTDHSELSFASPWAVMTDHINFETILTIP